MDADWRDRPGDLLYDGEAVVESVDADGSRVVVTSHRVLAFAPDRDPRFRQVDRPNATGVRVESAGKPTHRQRAARAAAWGVGLVVAGALVSFDAALPSARDLGVVDAGGVLSLLGALFAVLALLDDALRAAGALLLLAAVAFAARYVRGREQVVVLAVSGGDDVEVPGDQATASALRDALDSA